MRFDLGAVVLAHDLAVAGEQVREGVRALLNFAPIQLHVPEDVSVKNVNLALELETLSYALAHRNGDA